jgi:hypothetical protein
MSRHWLMVISLAKIGIVIDPVSVEYYTMNLFGAREYRITIHGNL